MVWQRTPRATGPPTSRGIFHVLSREHGVQFRNGAAILIESDVPEGKGVSSSAAIEAATMEAVVEAWSIAIEPKMRAVRCQQVENVIVGAPCGVMDQMASICGEAGSLMALLCQPAEFAGSVRLPDGLGVWGIDSGIRHAVTGADYGAVRVGAFMGYRIIADLAGLRVTAGERTGHVHRRSSLGRLSRERQARRIRQVEPAIPDVMDGAAFLARYERHHRSVTDVDPRSLRVRTPTRHPVYEHQRVTAWARCERPRRASGLMRSGSVR